MLDSYSQNIKDNSAKIDVSVLLMNKAIYRLNEFEDNDCFINAQDNFAQVYTMMDS